MDPDDNDEPVDVPVIHEDLDIMDNQGDDPTLEEAAAGPSSL